MGHPSRLVVEHRAEPLGRGFKVLLKALGVVLHLHPSFVTLVTISLPERQSGPDLCCMTADRLLSAHISTLLKPVCRALRTLSLHLVSCDAADCEVVAGGAGKVQAADGGCWCHGE